MSFVIPCEKNLVNCLYTSKLRVGVIKIELAEILTDTVLANWGFNIFDPKLSSLDIINVSHLPVITFIDPIYTL